MVVWYVFGGMYYVLRMYRLLTTAINQLEVPVETHVQPHIEQARDIEGTKQTEGKDMEGGKQRLVFWLAGSVPADSRPSKATHECLVFPLNLVRSVA